MAQFGAVEVAQFDRYKQSGKAKEAKRISMRIKLPIAKTG